MQLRRAFFLYDALMFAERCLRVAWLQPTVGSEANAGAFSGSPPVLLSAAPGDRREFTP